MCFLQAISLLYWIMFIARNIGPEDSEAKWSHEEEELTLHGRYQGRRLLIVRSAAQENEM